MPRRQVVIENPVLNSPYDMPKRHWRFADDGITDEKVEGRRPSSYFVPIAPPRKRGGRTQLSLDSGWTQDRVKENDWINQVRSEVHKWRLGGRLGVTPTTRRLLDYWLREGRDKRLFFCQIEAIETNIFIGEVAERQGVTWIRELLERESEVANPGLYRIALKMATGTGKTVVMAMIIAWQLLNKIANPKDTRFSDAFLVLTPGITIRDRLRVLLPNDPGNYFVEWDLVPPGQRSDLGKARIHVTNFHSFRSRDTVDAARVTKAILAPGAPEAFLESPDQVVARVCNFLGGKGNVVVLNDEAHHCYHRKPEEETEDLSGDEKREAERREEDARVWSSGLDWVKRRVGIRVIYDLSATPFFLSGSGYGEGTLFPWVVSDFSLIDAIESGIVKIPRVPVSDDQMKGAMPTYRDLWLRIHDRLPKRGKGTERISGEPNLPKELEGALESLYGDYEKQYKTWNDSANGNGAVSVPPVFIVVCNNTNVSKIVYDYVAGWEKEIEKGTSVVVPGRLRLFSNEANGAWLGRPNTILIDSAQLESGDPLSTDFKRAVAPAIDEFKAEYRTRFPGRDVETLNDSDILREVMNTVGKPGKLGESVKCIVSVSMLTEGWDANTVTHILGVRAFSTQLLCEQVIGRGLRRRRYAVKEDGTFDPEYAEVYGVPFSFIPCSGSSRSSRPEVAPTHVRAVPERAVCAISFPRIIGYKYDFPSDLLSAKFSRESKLTLSTAMLPSRVQLDPIVGESTVHNLDTLGQFRLQHVAFVVARRTLEQYFRDEEGGWKTWLFPQLLEITKSWMRECLVLKEDTLPQWLLMAEFAQSAADKIYHAVVVSSPGEKRVVAIPNKYDPWGSTDGLSFDTTRPVFATDPVRCHINFVVADTDSWEQRVALALEGMKEVQAYAKNQNLGFTVPYTYEGQDRDYIPDFVVRITDLDGSTLNLVLEVTGERRPDKEAKVATMKDLWVPGVNKLGTYGQWAFLELTDPYESKSSIRRFLKTRRTAKQEDLEHAD